MQRSRTVSGSARNPSCVVWPGMVTVTGNDVGAHSHQARFFKRQGGRITLSASAALIQEQAAEPAQASATPCAHSRSHRLPTSQHSRKLQQAAHASDSSNRATCVLLAAKLNSLHDLTYCPLILMPGTEPRASTPPSALPCSLLGCFLVPEAALSLAQALDDVQSSQGAVKAADQWQFGHLTPWAHVAGWVTPMHMGRGVGDHTATWLASSGVAASSGAGGPGGGDAVQLPLALAWPHLHHALLAFNSARQDQQGGQDQQDPQAQQGPQLRAARLALDPSAPLAAKSTPAEQPSTPPPSTAPQSQQVSKQETASSEPALGHPGVQAFQGGEGGPQPGLAAGAQARGNADRQLKAGPGTTPAGADGALRWLTARVLYVFTNHLDLAVLQLQPALEPEGYAALSTRCGSQHWPRSRLQRHASALQQLHDSLGSGGECDQRVTLPPSSSGPASCDGHVASDRCLALRRPDSGFAADLDGGELGPGDEVWVVGHGLFGPAAGWQPAVTAGNVAKAKVLLALPSLVEVISLVIDPGLGQTDESGASGGAVLDSEGRLCGLVTSNARTSFTALLHTVLLHRSTGALAAVTSAVQMTLEPTFTPAAQHSQGAQGAAHTLPAMQTHQGSPVTCQAQSDQAALHAEPAPRSNSTSVGMCGEEGWGALRPGSGGAGAWRGGVGWGGEAVVEAAVEEEEGGPGADEQWRAALVARLQQLDVREEEADSLKRSLPACFPAPSATSADQTSPDGTGLPATRECTRYGIAWASRLSRTKHLFKPGSRHKVWLL
ncbi:hypothetical protein V8C86DRAFT_2442437 [Haematococcus lacustris]